MAMSTTISANRIPREFIWQRIHSLTGFWFLLFLIEHLFTNSQAALFFGDDGRWFVHSVNFLHNLPYLQVIEVVLLGVPILIHAGWGIYYIFTSKSNAFRKQEGKLPKLTYARNRAFTYQRLSSWVILVGLILHVVQMRFIDYPHKFGRGANAVFYSKYTIDPGLYPVSDRLGVKLYDGKAILREKNSLVQQEHKMAMVQTRLKELQIEITSKGEDAKYNSELESIHHSLQRYEAQRQHIRGLESFTLLPGQVIGVSKNFGDIVLLSVRQTFQSIAMCIFYSIFVLASVFHGFNGLWSFLITWGVILSRKAHSKTASACIGLMFVIGLLGFMSIWGTYFINLKY